jgi:hypothetical protein
LRSTDEFVDCLTQAFWALFRRGLRLLAALLAIQAAFGDATPAGDRSEDTFHWKQAIAQSLLGIVYQNAFRVATQAETRDAIQGPFWRSYVDSIENYHGFNDGDGFFTSYILHPMQGSVAGFIERQNDPKYRHVEFGRSQRYWISCMRSLAFSTAFSVVWSATPFGEPGVGFVEKHNEPGVVDLVITHTLGLGWMIGEDALDRYLIKRIERRYRNPFIRGLARSTLNPTRGYANLLAFHKPWHRYTRPGVNEYTPGVSDAPRDEESAARFHAHSWPETTAVEFQADAIVQRYLGSTGSTCAGGGAEGAIQFPIIDLAFDVDGCELLGFPEHVTGDALNYMLGPRWRFYSSKRWVSFAELLVGGTKITHVMTDTAKERTLMLEAKQEGQGTPDYAAFHAEVDTNSFTALANIGVSYRINDALSWRVATFGYQHSWMLSHLQGSDYNQGIRFTTGIAFTLGPWRR